MEMIIRDPSRAVRLLLFEALKRDDPVLNQLAAEALVAIGRDVVPTLMIEILASAKVGYRLRLLQVIEAIGEMPDPGDRVELFNLTRDRNARVRAAAAQVVCAVGPQGSRGRPLVVEAATP
jgi:HEAT repeat protein